MSGSLIEERLEYFGGGRKPARIYHQDELDGVPVYNQRVERYGYKCAIPTTVHLRDEMKCHKTDSTTDDRHAILSIDSSEEDVNYLTGGRLYTPIVPGGSIYRMFDAREQNRLMIHRAPESLHYDYPDYRGNKLVGWHRPPDRWPTKYSDSFRIVSLNIHMWRTADNRRGQTHGSPNVDYLDTMLETGLVDMLALQENAVGEKYYSKNKVVALLQDRFQNPINKALKVEGKGDATVTPPDHVRHRFADKIIPYDKERTSRQNYNSIHFRPMSRGLRRRGYTAKEVYLKTSTPESIGQDPRRLAKYNWGNPHLFSGKAFTDDRHPAIGVFIHRGHEFVVVNVHLPLHVTIFLKVPQHKATPAQWAEAERLTSERRRHILEYLNRRISEEGYRNIMIVGDFNSYRRADYTEEEWKHLSRVLNPDSGIEPDHSATALLEQLGWIEGFDLIGAKPPRTSSIHGARCDFVYFSPTWDFSQISVQEVYLVQNGLSDHYPIGVDLKFH